MSDATATLMALAQPRLFALLLFATPAASLALGTTPLRVAPVRPPLRARPPTLAAPYEEQVDDALDLVDELVTSRVVRLANHAPAFASLSYFGLISSSMMMPAQMPAYNLMYVLTRSVGPTSNAAFAATFPTLVTPANFVFLIWPVIAVLQLATVTWSALRPGRPSLAQPDLSALTVANAAASGWLLVASNSLPGALPFLSFGLLPLVPLFAGYPLRDFRSAFSAPPRGLSAVALQTFSSFTTIASFLALAVELQHGGRLPLFPAEAAAAVFLAGVGAVVALPGRSLVKRGVNALALTGILAKRLAAGAAAPASLALSLSFVATVGLWGWAVKKLVAE